MIKDSIVIVGAREHNLKNITVAIPRNRLTVITGLSGSGKSSLAFDTLYAEGQRRYVESLSAYARQFLEQMPKPDVNSIEGLSPAIAIEQRTAASNPRSTVATATEIYDYLRLLYAHVGERHCPRCGRVVRRQSPEEIVELLLELPNLTHVTLLAPRVRNAKGDLAPLLAAIQKEGFVRVRVDGQVTEVESLAPLDPNRPHTIETVVDRLVITDRIRARLTDSVETALKHGQGVIVAVVQKEGHPPEEYFWSEKNFCVECGINFEELSARSFSFNSPYGACAGCGGLGTRLVFDETLVVPDPSLSLEAGAIQAWRRGTRRLIIYYKQLLRAVARHYGFSMETPFKNLPARIRKILLHGSGKEEIEFGYWRSGVYRRYRRPFEGVIPNLTRRYQSTESDYVREKLRTYMSRQPCHDCKGQRLKPEVLACTVNGRSIADVLSVSVGEALQFIRELNLSAQQLQIVGDVVREIERRLHFLREVGLDYLTLNRESGTLAGGELQRIRLASQIGSGLVGVLYVLDEPTIGLHVRDTERLIRMLYQLRDVGNTIVVVEHDEKTIRSADYVIDLGPGAGRHGGYVVAAGTVGEVLQNEKSLTARYLRREARIADLPQRKPCGKFALKIWGARHNNLKNIDVTIPLGLLVCVTGVSGSGKSSLIDDVLRRALFRRFYGAKELPGAHERITGVEYLDRVIVVDQSPIGRTPRSNPATYTGAFAFIRELFAETPAARVHGYGPGRFSFNIKGGRCEVCKGDGILRLEMHFLPEVYVTCERCQGLRYNHETLEVHYAGKNIAEVLAMTVDEALEFFRNIPQIARRLQTLSEVGLGYLQLGQRATTLSGGEAQRLKLASELSKVATGRTLYILDEPTTGLHFADTETLLRVLRRLRNAGNSVVVIEHNLDVIKAADYIIDLGPEGGEKGGWVVAVGTPEEVARCERSYTGAFLRKALTA